MLEASLLGMSPASGQTSLHNSVLGGGTSMPLVATESRKHVVSSERSFDGTSETKGPNDTSDREGNEAGVNVRPCILSVRGSVSERVGVDGNEE